MGVCPLFKTEFLNVKYIYLRKVNIVYNLEVGNDTTQSNIALGLSDQIGL